MNPKTVDRINPYPTRENVISGIIWLSVIMILFVVPIIEFFFWKKTFGFFLIWIIPIFLLYEVGIKIFSEIDAFKNRDRFMKVSLSTEAKVLDNRWIRHEDSDEFQVIIEFQANTTTNGVLTQKLKLSVPENLYKNIGDSIPVRYSRLNPRIAILKSEADAMQISES